MPENSRPRKLPERYRDDSPLTEELDIKTEWWRQYCEAIDLIVNELERRFCQEGMAVSAAREELLISGARGDASENFEESKLPGCIVQHDLFLQLKLLSSLWDVGERIPTSLKDVLHALKNSSEEFKACLPEVIIFKI
jgi:hypothetical protein